MVNRHQVEVFLNINVAGRLNGDHWRVRGQLLLHRLIVELCIRLQIRLPGELTQGIAVLEEQYPVMACRVTKGDGQGVVPLDAIGSGQPARAAAVAIGANLDPFLAVLLQACIDVEVGKRQQLCVRRLTRLAGNPRTGHGQYALVEAVFTFNQERLVSASGCNSSHSRQGRHGDDECK